MKQYVNLLCAVALAVAATATLSSCGNDDDDIEVPGTKTVKEAVTYTTFYANRQLIDTYDIVGTSGSGATLSFSPEAEQITLADGSKETVYAMVLESRSATLPVESVMRLTFTLKGGYELPAESTFVYGQTASGTITYSDGSTAPFYATGFSGKSSKVKPEGIPGITNFLNRNFGYIKVELKADEIDVETESELD